MKNFLSPIFSESYRSFLDLMNPRPLIGNPRKRANDWPLVRPGRIAEEIKVPLTMPRTATVLSEESFVRLVSTPTRFLFEGP